MDYNERKESFINDIIEDIESSNLSLFLGAGVSFGAGLPSWKMLLKDLAKRIHIDIEKQNDYYQVAQYCENHIAKNIRNDIRRKLRSRNYESSIVKSILHLPVSSFWTTNFDEVLEKNIEMEFNVTPEIIYRDEDLIKTREKYSKIVYKVNGHIEDQESWVLTKNDLEQYAYTHPALLTFLRRELIVNTFLFLGYSFTDTLVLSALKDIRRYLNNKITHYHYTIMEESNSDSFSHFIKNLEINYGIKTLIIPKQDDAKNNERSNVVNLIVKRIKNKQVFISGSFRKISKDEETFITQFSKHLTHNILERGNRICNAFGRGVGSRFIEYASEWLLNHNQPLDKKLILRTRPFHTQSNTNNITFDYRKFLMRDSGIVVFICGQDRNDNDRSHGVEQEFKVAKELDLKIIPVGCTGGESKVIWNEIRQNISHYGYLEKYIDYLGNATDPLQLANIVMQIIEEIQEVELH